MCAGLVSLGVRKFRQRLPQLFVVFILFMDPAGGISGAFASDSGSSGGF